MLHWCPGGVPVQQAPSSSVGRYQPRGPLGAGGFATVYRAYDPVLDREVALKILHPHLATDPEIRERFVREGQALARVHHPNIVQIHDAGNAEDTTYLAMQLVEGRSLDVIVRERGPLPLHDGIAMAEQIAAALAAVHARGLTHRDVKPVNILIEHITWRAVLLDFGVARPVDSRGAATGWLVGTPGFMAPEQLDPDSPATPRTDVYQLAATLYALLAGRPPFTGRTADVLNAILSQPPLDLGKLRPDLPAAAVAAIADAMSKNPKRRPSGPVAFVAALRAAAEQTHAALTTSEEIPLKALATGRSDLTQPTVNVAVMDLTETRRMIMPPAAEPAGVVRRGRRKLFAVSAGLVLLAAAAAVGGLRLRAGDDVDQARAVTVTPTVEFTATPAAEPSATATPASTPPLMSSPGQPSSSRTPTPTRTPSPTATATRGAPFDVNALLRAEMFARGFTPEGPIYEAPAGARGGTLYAQKGTCIFETRAKCQQMFFMVDKQVVGTDSVSSAQSILDIEVSGVARIDVTYANYASRDPRCCPSRSPVTVTYFWDGSRLNVIGAPPG